MWPSLQNRIKGLNNLKRVKKSRKISNGWPRDEKIITGSLCLCFEPVHQGTRFLPDVPFDAGEGDF